MIFSLVTCLVLALAVPVQSTDIAANVTTYEQAQGRSLRGARISSDTEHRMLNILAFSSPSTRGQLEEGDACDKHVQCQVGHYCNNVCKRQQHTGTSSTRECTNKGDDFCRSWNCVGYQSLGYADNLYQAGTMFCSNEAKNDANNVNRGGTCTNDVQCDQSEDYCGSSGSETICLERKSVGSTCTRDEECESNRCMLGSCVDPSNYPSNQRLVCEFDTDCTSGECADDNKCACPGAPKHGDKYYIRVSGTDYYLWMHNKKGGLDNRMCIRRNNNDAAYKFIADAAGDKLRFGNQKRGLFIGTTSHDGQTVGLGQSASEATTKWDIVPADDSCSGFAMKYGSKYLMASAETWSGDGHHGKLVLGNYPQPHTFEYISTVI